MSQIPEKMAYKLNFTEFMMNITVLAGNCTMCYSLLSLLNERSTTAALAKTGPVELDPRMVKHIVKCRLRRMLGYDSTDVYKYKLVYRPNTWLRTKERHAYLSLLTSLYDKETP